MLFPSNLLKRGAIGEAGATAVRVSKAEVRTHRETGGFVAAPSTMQWIGDLGVKGPVVADPTWLGVGALEVLTSRRKKNFERH